MRWIRIQISENVEKHCFWRTWHMMAKEGITFRGIRIGPGYSDQSDGYASPLWIEGRNVAIEHCLNTCYGQFCHAISFLS